MRKPTLTEKQKNTLRNMTREQVVAHVVKSFDSEINEATNFLEAANVWMALPQNADERPLDLEKLRVTVANLRRKRERFIEANANCGPHDQILMPE